jgi:ribose-phosphate pyrophosphokinase
MKKVVLLADPQSRAWNFAKKIQDYLEQERHTHVPVEKIEIGFFGNDETKMHVTKNIRGKEVYFIHDSTKKPNDWWAELLLTNNLLNLASVENINFVLPDIKYSKQDKKKQSRVPISSVAVAESLKYSPRLKKVFTIDLHAPQIQGFWSPVPLDNLSSTPTVVRHLKEKSGIEDLEEMVLVAADKGDFDRAIDYAERLHSRYPVAMVYKRRELNGDREIKKDTSVLIGEIEGRRVFCADDIFGTGKTIGNVAELLRDNGAIEANTYATHGWFTNGTKIITEAFDRVMTSNTHNYKSRKGVSIIDVSPVFAEAIWRAQKGLSISELYENHK